MACMERNVNFIKPVLALSSLCLAQVLFCTDRHQFFEVLFLWLISPLCRLISICHFTGWAVQTLKRIKLFFRGTRLSYIQFHLLLMAYKQSKGTFLQGHVLQSWPYFPQFTESKCIWKEKDDLQRKLDFIVCGLLKWDGVLFSKLAKTEKACFKVKTTRFWVASCSTLAVEKAYLGGMKCSRPGTGSTGGIENGDVMRTGTDRMSGQCSPVFYMLTECLSLFTSSCSLKVKQDSNRSCQKFM